MKNAIVILSTLVILFSCKKEEKKEAFGQISFASNYHIINCVGKVSVYIDDAYVGDISKASTTINDCGIDGNVSKQLSVGTHTYKVLVGDSNAGNCYKEITATVNIEADECEKVFVDMNQIFNNGTFPFPFFDIGKGQLNGSEGIEKSNKIITDSLTWQNLMNQMNTFNNLTDGFSETNINFNTHMLLAVFLEQKFSGWEIEITNIEESASKIKVLLKETESVTTVISQPYHIVKIPKTEKEIVFELE